MRRLPGFAWWPSAVLSVAVLGVLVAPLMAGWRDEGITRGAEDRALVALTFDDGLNGETTATVARILEQYEARGTFFVVGSSLEREREGAVRLSRAGHLLANHSYSHPRASRLDIEYRELSTAQRAFKRAVGTCPALYRPPFGAETPFTKAAVRRAQMRTVLWDVEVGDWAETDPARLTAGVLAKVRPGSIVLLHDGTEGRPDSDRTVLVRALPAILEGLRARRLRAVRVDELLGVPGYLERC